MKFGTEAFHAMPLRNCKFSENYYRKVILYFTQLNSFKIQTSHN